MASRFIKPKIDKYIQLYSVANTQNKKVHYIVALGL